MPNVLNLNTPLQKGTVIHELMDLQLFLSQLGKNWWTPSKDHMQYVAEHCPHCIDVQATLMGIFDIFGQSMIYSCHENCFHVTYRNWYECNMTTINELCDYVKQCIEIVKEA